MRLLSELQGEIRSERLRGALFAALLLGGLALIDAVALSSIIFAGPLSPFVLQGTSMLLLGHVACLLVVALLSSHRGMVAIPQEAPAAVLATVGVPLTEAMAGASDASLAPGHGIDTADPVPYTGRYRDGRPATTGRGRARWARECNGPERAACGPGQSGAADV